MSAAVQPISAKKLGKRLAGGRDALAHQRLRIGFHQHAGPAAGRVGVIALAKFAMFGRRPQNAAQQPVARPTQRPIAQHNRRAAGADGQRGERRFDVPPRERNVRVQQINGCIHQGTAVFGADDHAGANLPQLDHVGHLDHAVQQAETGVRRS